jgi:hypothetical protein
MINKKFVEKYPTLVFLDYLPDSDKKSNLVIDLYKVSNPSKEYLPNGFRFTDERLNEIKGAVVFFPIDFMVDYISLELKNLIDKKDTELQSQIKSLIKSPDLFYVFQQMKPVYLGLCSYASLNILDDDVIDASLTFIKMYQDWYICALLNDREGISDMVDKYKRRLS